jgi:hypothetical protein
MRSHIGCAALVLGTVLAATPAHATTFRVDAETNGSTIIRQPCDGGPCCNTCHVGQLKDDGGRAAIVLTEEVTGPR